VWSWSVTAGAEIIWDRGLQLEYGRRECRWRDRVIHRDNLPHDKKILNEISTNEVIYQTTTILIFPKSSFLRLDLASRERFVPSSVLRIY
jgi:hypothetical protein